MSDVGFSLMRRYLSHYPYIVLQCTEMNVKHKHDKDRLSKLAMHHLIGAFYIALLTGYVL